MSRLVVAFLLAVAIAACGSPKAGPSSTPASDLIAACDHYFDANQSPRCGGPALPASELARLRARFEPVCQGLVSLPGTGDTAATLDACATALDASPCGAPRPTECVVHGSEPMGAACNDDAQCQSAICYRPENMTPPWYPWCGTCAAVAPIGQKCDFSSAGCAAGASCVRTSATAQSPSFTCEVIDRGDVGAPCDGLTVACKSGRYCSALTHQCAKLGGAGDACGGTPGTTGCIAPFACVNGACSSAPSGATCASDAECAPGLGCVNGACGAVTWGAPGEVCFPQGPPNCLMGVCGGSGILAADASLACPTIIADGQPCGPDGTCDAFSACFQNRCTRIDETACR